LISIVIHYGIGSSDVAIATCVQLALAGHFVGGGVAALDVCEMT